MWISIYLYSELKGVQAEQTTQCNVAGNFYYFLHSCNFGLIDVTMKQSKVANDHTHKLREDIFFSEIFKNFDMLEIILKENQHYAYSGISIQNMYMYKVKPK